MASKTEESDGGASAQEAQPQIKQPSYYSVILHNDEFTTMEFVVEILRLFFHKTEEIAVHIMLIIHQEGKAVAGVYHLEIAETKVMQVHERARSKGFPLRCSLEPA